MELVSIGSGKKDESKYTLLHGNPMDQLISTLQTIQQATDLSIGEKALIRMEEEPDDFTKVRKKIHVNIVELKKVRSWQSNAIRKLKKEMNYSIKEIRKMWSK